VPSQKDLILDQFTRQAEPFSNAAPITDEAALALILQATSAGADDLVLDVACGPGIVVCAFARVVRHATGIDLTPAMLQRARGLASERGLLNVSWRLGDVLELPFPDAAFSIVVSRLAFHHFEQPAAVLKEMRRVCRTGGKVAVIDIVAPPDPSHAAALHETERLRDPSHVRFLAQPELVALFQAAALPTPKLHGYRLALELESWLSRSFPDPRDIPEIRRRIAASLADNRLGIGTRREGDQLHFSYDVAIGVSYLSASS
jgi:SAM-dependent methyltransferase